MMRVLFLLSHTEKGGGEVVLFNLVKNIDRKKVAPFVGHVDFRKGDFIHEFKSLGVEPVDFQAGRLRQVLRTWATVKRIASYLSENRIDLVFTSGAHNHVYGWLAAKIAGVPTVTYVMNHYKTCWSVNPAIIQVSLLMRPDYYAAASESCMSPLEPYVSGGSRGSVVYHGADESFVNKPADPLSIRRKLGLSDRQRLVSIIGRLQRWKGQDVFIKAAHIAAGKNRDAQFAVVGGALFGLEQDYPPELKALADRLGLGGRIHFAGHQHDVQSWMAASDVIVHASRSPEPGAQALIEALSLGRPLVATDCGAPGEIIKDGVSGFLVPPDDEKQMAEKIVRLLGDPEEAARIGAGAKERARAFTARSMAEKFEAIFEKVLRPAGDFKKILVIRNNHIGDLLIITPLLRDLKRLYPSAEITVAAGPWAAEILAGNPAVHDLRVMDFPWGNRKHRAAGKVAAAAKFFLSPEMGGLAGRRFDLGIDVSGHYLNGLMMARCGIPVRIAVQSGSRRPLLATHSVRHLPDAHVTGSILKIIPLLGGTPGSLDPEIKLDPGASDFVKAELEKSGLNSYAVIAPGAGWPPSKCWIPASFAKTAALLRREFGLSSVIVGSPGEKELTALVAREAGAGAHDWGGKLTLSQYAALVSGASLVICNNSSALHVAAAFKRPAVVICGGHYGGVRLQEKCWGYGANTLFLGSVKKTECHITCGDTCASRECMLETTPEAVLEAAGRLLGGKKVKI